MINREDVQNWCLDKGFELVELNPVEEDYDLGINITVPFV